MVVCLRCKNRMAGVIIDRFGWDTMMAPKGDSHFTTHVLIAQSPQFFGWMASNCTDVEILEPQSLRKECSTFLKNIIAI